MDRLPRLLRTVLPLRTSQIAWRLRYALERRYRRPPGAGRGAPAPLLRAVDPAILPPVLHRSGASGRAACAGLAAGTFAHLNREVDLGRKRPEWLLGPQAEHRLWIVTLHYQGWAYELAEVAGSASPLSDQASTLFREYVGDWIERCDLAVRGARELAWNSYAIATRIPWWIRSYLAAPGIFAGPPGGFDEIFRLSLARQASWLCDHIEWDLRGNHVLRDLVGLAWAGRLLDAADAPRWLDAATRFAPAQLAEQVLPDGSHFERSPMYHVHVMEDVLALALLLRDPPVRAMATRTLAAMADYLNWVRHPDGELPLFNDGALHAAARPAALLAELPRLGIVLPEAKPRGGRHFQAAGLVVWHGDPWTLFFDVGEVGAEIIPGHAHADSLSLECSFQGQRLFVDPGTYAYDSDANRAYDRSTAAHNTVVVDGEDSSEVWHIFRVGRRARPRDVQVEIRGDGLRATAAHDGYRHLPGRPIHRRTITVEDGGALVLADRVEGHGTHRLEAGLLVDPAWSVEPGSTGWILARGDDRVRVRIDGGSAVSLQSTRAAYHPEYGRELQCPRLRWTFGGLLPREARCVVEGSRR